MKNIVRKKMLEKLKINRFEVEQSVGLSHRHPTLLNETPQQNKNNKYIATKVRG